MNKKEARRSATRSSNNWPSRERSSNRRNVRVESGKAAQQEDFSQSTHETQVVDENHMPILEQ